MTEIFTSVRDEVKNMAETCWNICLAQNNPDEAAKFLHLVTEFYRNYYTEEEIEFLQFYFNMKLEMMKE